MGVSVAGGGGGKLVGLAQSRAVIFIYKTDVLDGPACRKKKTLNFQVPSEQGSGTAGRFGGSVESTSW